MAEEMPPENVVVATNSGLLDYPVNNDMTPDVELDSLVVASEASSTDAAVTVLEDDEIEKAFMNVEDEDEPEVEDAATSVMSASRASVDSQRSVSFFVDFNDESTMAKSAIVTPRMNSGRRTRSQQGDRLTQSMYVRSDSQSSCVSFFVDISDVNKNRNRLVHSMSREEANHDLDELSEDMRIKSSILLAQNLDQTKTFFKKLKDYVDFLATPSYSKDELRQKRRMGEDISRLMFEEEQKLKNGQKMSSMADLDKVLLGHGSLNPKQRPVSAYCGNSSSASAKKPLNPEERPVLRRERTFDLDPKPSLSKLVEVNIEPVTDNHQELGGGDRQQPQSEAEIKTLQMFQQQRLFHTMRLKREIAKLEKMERDLAANKGPEPRPRQCWTDSSSAATPKRPARKRDGRSTTFKDLANNSEGHFKVNMTDSMESESSNNSFTWFIPGDHDQDSPIPAPRQSRSAGTVQRPSSSSYTNQRSRASQTGKSLVRQFQEKKDKAVYVRDRPQAYFIECEGLNPRPKSAVEPPVASVRKSKMLNNNNNNNVTTTIIDLETDTLPDDKNLQEALRRKRPDYIAKTKTREQDRLAKSFVAANKNAITINKTPVKLRSSVAQAKHIYGATEVKASKSRIPMKAELVKQLQNGHRSETVTIQSRPRRPVNTGQGKVTCSDPRPRGLSSNGITNNARKQQLTSASNRAIIKAVL
jgi:hypothetical protein